MLSTYLTLYCTINHVKPWYSTLYSSVTRQLPVFTHAVGQLICRMSAKHPSRLVVHGSLLICYCMLALYVLLNCYCRLALYVSCICNCMLALYAGTHLLLQSLYVLLICYVSMALYVLLICYVRLALYVYQTNLCTLSCLPLYYLPAHRVRCTIKCACMLICIQYIAIAVHIFLGTHVF